MRFSILLAVSALLLAPPIASAAFTAEQRSEIVTIVREALLQDPTILRDAVTALQADETARERAGAQAALTAMREKLVTPTDPIAGNAKGDVTVVEFFDVRCPYCKKLEPEMAKLLAADKGVKLVYKDLPILGPASTLGAKALLAAHRQNAYEKFRDAVMAMPGDIGMASLEAVAKKQGLDWAKMARDIDDPAIRAQLDANLALAHTLNIQGTPALIVGEEVVPGAIDAAEMKKLVAAARKTKG
ncbi:MAG: DsbA family protein [Rhodospirillales bacterium]